MESINTQKVGLMKISPADKYFSLCVRLANDNICETCGKFGRMEASHVYSRRHRTIRWDTLNIMCQCNGCHRQWHESPLRSFQWFEKQYGSGRVDLLREKMQNKNKTSKLEEKDIAKHYRQQLAILQKKRDQGETGVLDFESWQ